MKSLPGIVHHERMGQQELADLQLSCEAWLYPHQDNEYGGFLETFAIVALEAQAARVKIISRNNGALPETIKYSIWWTKEFDIVETLKNIDSLWRPEWTEENYQWAISKTWESLAVEWAKMLAPKEEAIVAV